MSHVYIVYTHIVLDHLLKRTLEYTGQWSCGRFSYRNLATTYILSNPFYSEPRLFILWTIWDSDGRCVQATGTHSQWLNEPLLLGIPRSWVIYKTQSLSVPISLSNNILLYCACCPEHLRASLICYSLILPVQILHLSFRSHWLLHLSEKSSHQFPTTMHHFCMLRVVSLQHTWPW